MHHDKCRRGDTKNPLTGVACIEWVSLVSVQTCTIRVVEGCAADSVVAALEQRASGQAAAQVALLSG